MKLNMHFHLTIYHIINGILKLFSQKFTSYFNQIDISNLTSSIFSPTCTYQKSRIFRDIKKHLKQIWCTFIHRIWTYNHFFHTPTGCFPKPENAVFF